MAPLRRIGDTIGKIPGFSIFAGPLGWLFTAFLLISLAMIAAAFTWGHRRRQQQPEAA